MKQTILNENTDSHEVLRRVAADAQKSKKAAGGYVADMMTGWMAGEFAQATLQELAMAERPRRWELMQACIQNWTRLRRSDRAAERAELAREQLELQRANSQAQKQREFRAWMRRPEIRKEYEEKPGGLTEDVLEAIERKLNLM